KRPRTALSPGPTPPTALTHDPEDRVTESTGDMPADASPELASPELASPELADPDPDRGGADETETDAGGRGRRAAGDEPDLALLEREGDIAADYLEALLDIADLDGDIDIDVEGTRAAVSIVGADLSKLVGEQGATLEALQELTRLAVTRETGARS